MFCYTVLLSRVAYRKIQINTFEVAEMYKNCAHQSHNKLYFWTINSTLIHSTFHSVISFFTKLALVFVYFSIHSNQGRDEGGKGGATARAPSHYGGAKSLRASSFFSTVHLLPKDFSFEHAGRQTCFLPRAPSNLATTLIPTVCLFSQSFTLSVIHLWLIY